MHSVTLIIAVCWIAFWFYWIISALGSKKSTASNVRQFVGIRLGIIGLAAILTPLFNRLPDSLKNHVLGTNGIIMAVGFAVFLLGMMLAVWARIYLGRNWGMPMTKKQDSELVTSGPYQYIRHPIYTGILLMALGSAVDVNSYWLLVFVIAGIFFIYSAVAEERLMTNQFPKTYPPYKARTKMLIPFLF